MYSMTRYVQAMETWQTACVVYGKMVVSAHETMLRQSMDQAQSAMRPDQTMRRMLDRQATFAKSFQAAAEAAAAKRGSNQSPLKALDQMRFGTKARRDRLRLLARYGKE